MNQSSQKKVLVVDDDREIRELLDEYLTKVGFEVITAADGTNIDLIINEQQPDLVILDIMLPGDDGFTLCQKIRRYSAVPLIMLTASSDETDRVIGLEMGADDYIAKPFSPRELQARIKALLRRSQITTQTQQTAARYICFDRWRLDTLTRKLIDADGEAQELSGSDYTLLNLFLLHPNSILDRDTISDVTRGREALPLDRSIDVQISRLRQRLGDSGKNPRLIKTIRGSGYVLSCEVRYET